MISLVGILVFLLAAVAAGKRSARPGRTALILGALFALLQVCIVLADMFTMGQPGM